MNNRIKNTALLILQKYVYLYIFLNYLNYKLPAAVLLAPFLAELMLIHIFHKDSSHSSLIHYIISR